MIGVLTHTGTLQAHHSGSMYETKPVWVQGTVISFKHANPHTIITLEDRSMDGYIRRWAVEGPGQFQLDRIGTSMFIPRAGDTIKFCAFPYKPAEELSRMFPGADFSARHAGSSSLQFVAGHVMIMPDSGMQLWEPHGRIIECIRTSDEQRQSWVKFLNTNLRARQAWCQQREFASAHLNSSLREVIDEINVLLTNPCD